MRSALLSLTAIGAVGAALVAGGTFSVFNDSGQVTGTYTNGTVKISLGSTSLTTNAQCTPLFTDANHTDATQNMGSVNNKVCATNVVVTNAGTLPLQLSSSGSSVVDTISSGPATADGAACFVSSLTSLGGVINPGATQTVQVSTSVNPDNACQNRTDALALTLLANEARGGGL